MSESITWTNVRVTLGQLKPWEDNPRRSTKAQAKRIVASWERFGQAQVLLIGPDYQVYDGHQRLSALLKVYGKDYELDARQTTLVLGGNERRAFVLAMNGGASGEINWDVMSTWDAALLVNAGFDAEMKAMLDRDALAVSELLASVSQVNWDDAAGKLPTEDRAPFQQMTFTLHDAQVEQVKAALDAARNIGDFDDSQNKNGNGNALAFICETFVTAHGNS